MDSVTSTAFTVILSILLTSLFLSLAHFLKAMYTYNQRVPLDMLKNKVIALITVGSTSSLGSLIGSVILVVSYDQDLQFNRSSSGFYIVYVLHVVTVGTNACLISLRTQAVLQNDTIKLHFNRVVKGGIVLAFATIVAAFIAAIVNNHNPSTAVFVPIDLFAMISGLTFMVIDVYSTTCFVRYARALFQEWKSDPSVFNSPKPVLQTGMIAKRSVLICVMATLDIMLAWVMLLLGHFGQVLASAVIFLVLQALTIAVMIAWMMLKVQIDLLGDNPLEELLLFQQSLTLSTALSFKNPESKTAPSSAAVKLKASTDSR
eukprot:TRINITY_DN61092_c0_g1_i1.p1 TRINITY_DN61092_c0_g1~~TRINITY_DN61092_c0_g1_i1.p1  ORF type:complete len:317 (+),score=71.70 TRINITY_DN61092_c0_g1_i1:168-1118(+)